MALTQIDDRGLKTPIDLIDNEKIRLGTGNDLEIYHDGTNNQIKCAVDNQDITITSTKDLYLKTGDGSTGTHTFLYAADNAGVELRYDNVKKLETSAGGVSITGELAVTSDVHFNSATNAGKDVYWDESASELQFSNDVKAKFGDGLEISHSGSNDASYIKESGTSNLYIYSENLRMMSADGSEAYIEANNNGAVELYYNNSKKLETTSTGITVTGKVNPTGNIHMPDNVGIKLGASDDLVLWHYNGDNKNYITSANDRTLRIQADTGDETMAQFIPNGAVELYYDGTKRVETTSTGASVYGSLYCSENLNLTNDNKKINLGDSSDLQIYHSGSHSYIKDTGTGALNFCASALYVTNAADSENMIAATENGGVSLYYDGTKKIETKSYGVNMPDNSQLYFGTGDDLAVYHDGTHSYIKNATNDLLLSANYIKLQSPTGENCLVTNLNGAVELFYDNTKVFRTTSSGINVGTHTGGQCLNQFNSGYYDYADDTESANIEVNTNVLLFVSAQKSNGGTVNYPNAIYHITYTGDITRLSQSHDSFSVNTDTDGKICVFKQSNGQFRIKNRTGGDNKIGVTVLHAQGV